MINQWTSEGMGALVNYGQERGHGNSAQRMGQVRGGKRVPLEPFTIHRTHFW
jgi:hypothetical protein